MNVNRYQRQELLPQIGKGGQERIRAARVLLVGCGALGSVMADYLVRAGVGEIVIADRDIVEWTNLQRQVLFEEEDAKGGIPKVVAAKERLGRVNGDVRVEALVVDVHGGNLEEILKSQIRNPNDETSPKSEIRRGFDLILDGTDNVETRYLVNDVAVKWGIPWVYGACVGWEGRVMGVLGGGGGGGGAGVGGEGGGGVFAVCLSGEADGEGASDV
jgi:adenylyltransferase/sulfurtransferase